MFELNEASTDTPSPKDAAIIVRSRLGLEPAEVRRFLTGLCHYVYSVTTSDRQKFVARIATPSTKRLLAGGIYWNELLRPMGGLYRGSWQPTWSLQKSDFHSWFWNSCRVPIYVRSIKR